MFTILDYSSALEYSIIRRYTNIVYYYYIILLLSHLYRDDSSILCTNCIVYLTCTEMRVLIYVQTVLFVSLVQR